MKNLLEQYGELILFYLVVIIGILLLNMRFTYLNNLENFQLDNNRIAMNN